MNLFRRGGHLPTEPGQVSLPQRGQDICKPRYDEKLLQKQFHEMQGDNFWQIVREVHDFTQLAMEPIWSLYEATRYISTKNVRGDLVECGVFFGGASRAIVNTCGSGCFRRPPFRCVDRRLTVVSVG